MWFSHLLCVNDRVISAILSFVLVVSWNGSHQLSLLGSILSNLLLVLGCAFFLGGTKYKTQTFNKTGVSMNSALLLLAVISLSVPSILHTTHTEMHGTDSELALSRFTSVILLGVYGTFLYFQLVTHRDLYEEEEDEDDDDDEV
jgi:Ca2+:H+ antiporter